MRITLVSIILQPVRSIREATIKDYDRVFQFKVALDDIKPPIWRRIQVPETYTFWELHVAIQDAMGWADYHLHCFFLTDNVTRQMQNVGMPELDLRPAVIPDQSFPIANWFNITRTRAHYEYDFGDGWRHTIVFEGALPREAGVVYPVCLAGKRACPPEDCGSIPGYERLLEILNNPQHEEYEEMIEWLGDVIDLEYFDASEVVFDDLVERWRMANE
ncbi:MAG: plasmid pRiA4b ORF-3 family protein [Actinomycetota bacterium]